METPTTWIGLFFLLGTLLISSIGVWIVEFRKHQNSKKQNGRLKAIADTLKVLDKKQDEMTVTVIKTATLVNAQTKHCENTVKSVFKEIGKNSDRIFELKGKAPIE